MFLKETCFISGFNCTSKGLKTVYINHQKFNSILISIMSKLIHTITELRQYLKSDRQNQTIGFVPTMGALHIGHLSLIHRAKTENDLVIVSIFVNPLQFGPKEDFSKYPRTLNQDLEICQKAGVDVVFAPSVEELYPQGQTLLTTVIPPQSMTDILCGLNRPGHFQGVTTIVSKLFNIVGSDRAYFGQKDAQQVAIIKKMVFDLNIPVEIVVCPTIRETTGLAFSSRNQYLSSTEKTQAAIIYQSLQEAKKIFMQGERDRSILIKTVEQKMSLLKQLKIEYIDLVDPIT
jgi:pantoate ligase / CMP/dCMP kinase